MAAMTSSAADPSADPSAHRLSDGTSAPLVGFGTYPLKGEDGIEAMVSALHAGYRYLDSAVNYGNEEEVGEALRRSGVPREALLANWVDGAEVVYIGKAEPAAALKQAADRANMALGK